MEEGNETQNNNEQTVPSPLGHEQLFVFIFIGLLAIIGISVVFLNSPKDDVSSPSNAVNETMVPSTFVDVDGRNKNVLGIGVHKSEGRIYTHPESSMTLYVNKSVNCTNECLNSFTAYVSEKGVYHKTPNGDLLYLHNGDVFPGDTNGDEIGLGWQIARP